MSSNIATLPAFGATWQNVITAGYSSGAETSAHLLLAFPEIFDCAGVIDGAMPLTLQQTQSENGEDYVSYNTEEEDYQILVDTISQMEEQDQLGDLSLLMSENKAAYIFAGEQDDVVLPWANRQMRRYFQEAGVSVKYESDPELGHYPYWEKTVAMDVAKYCYDTLGAGITLKDYTIGIEFLTKGTFGKFDQFEFVKELDADVPELRQWGFYYFPDACKEKSCQFQLTIHGCGMSAEEFSTSFGNYAAANDIILVLPQASNCFMGDVEDDEKAAVNQVSRDGGMMTFMSAIFERVISDWGPDSLAADLESGKYVYNHAYPAGTWEDYGEVFGDDEVVENLQLVSITSPSQDEVTAKSDGGVANKWIGLLGLTALAAIGYKFRTKNQDKDDLYTSLTSQE